MYISRSGEPGNEAMLWHCFGTCSSSSTISHAKSFQALLLIFLQSYGMKSITRNLSSGLIMFFCRFVRAGSSLVVVAYIMAAYTRSPCFDFWQERIRMGG